METVNESISADYAIKVKHTRSQCCVESVGVFSVSRFPFSVPGGGSQHNSPKKCNQSSAPGSRTAPRQTGEERRGFVGSGSGHCEIIM